MWSLFVQLCGETGPPACLQTDRSVLLFVVWASIKLITSSAAPNTNRCRETLQRAERIKLSCRAGLGSVKRLWTPESHPVQNPSPARVCVGPQGGSEVRLLFSYWLICSEQLNQHNKAAVLALGWCWQLGSRISSQEPVEEVRHRWRTRI